MIEIVYIDVQRAPLTFVFFVDWDRSDTLLAVNMPLHDLFCQRFAYDLTKPLGFTLAVRLSNRSRTVCNLRTFEGRKHSLC